MQAGEALGHPVVAGLACKYGETSAQVILPWHVQHGLLVIPKSVTLTRIRRNLALFDFALGDDEMRAIDGMARGQRIGADSEIANFK